MSQPYVGQIIAVGFNFAPAGWSLCNGALVPISQNQALFALIGTTYGGDGINTFALPDLRSRAAIGMGQGSGLSNYVIGQVSGSESVTLTTQTVPGHTHNPMVNSGSGNAATPSSSVVLANPVGGGQMYVMPTAATSFEPTAIGQTVGAQSQGHENRQPLLAINYIIAQFGIFPSRN